MPTHKNASTQVLLSGNEAIAEACLASDVHIVAGYPGTPSTEIIERLKRNRGLGKLQAHWATNEKVALEIAIGASFTGKRSVATMKHVGLNVAADALMTFSYTGVGAGCVIVSADDPHMHSSQNEQDNRNYASFAKIPLLEPSDPQEAFTLMLLAFKISETFDTPILFRITARIAHATALVDLGQSKSIPFSSKLSKKTRQHIDSMKNWPKKKIMLPSFARIRHRWVEERLRLLADFSRNFPHNRYEKGNKNDILIITSSVPYLYIKEIFPDVSVYKVALSFPIPAKKIAEIAKKYKEVIAVEELDPFLENQLLVAGVKLRKRHYDFYCGELSPQRTRALVDHNKDIATKQDDKRPNPPMLCSGCPHLTVANLLREEDLTVSGDIGCYTLSALPPFEALDSVLAMGASLPILCGMALAYDRDTAEYMPPPKVAVIGDSTLLHAGLPGLIEARNLNPDAVICVLDNNTTAMTGRQDHPGVETIKNKSNKKKPSLSQEPFFEKRINYTKLAEAIGINNVKVVRSYHYEQCRFIFKNALAEEGLSLLVFEESCALLAPNQQTVAEVNENCVRCAECQYVGCPSIGFDEENKKPKINESTCIGCGICYSSCEYDALKPKSEHTLFDFLLKPEK